MRSEQHASATTSASSIASTAAKAATTAAVRAPSPSGAVKATTHSAPVGRSRAGLASAPCPAGTSAPAEGRARRSVVAAVSATRPAVRSGGSAIRRRRVRRARIGTSPLRVRRRPHHRSLRARAAGEARAEPASEVRWRGGRIAGRERAPECRRGTTRSSPAVAPCAPLRRARAQGHRGARPGKGLGLQNAAISRGRMDDGRRGQVQRGRRRSLTGRSTRARDGKTAGGRRRPGSRVCDDAGGRRSGDDVRAQGRPEQIARSHERIGRRRHGSEAHGQAIAPTPRRRAGGPSHVWGATLAVPPGDPRAGVPASRDPLPPEPVSTGPTTVVEGRPAPVIVTHPEVIVVVGPMPTGHVGSEIVADHVGRRNPNGAVRRILGPRTVGIQRRAKVTQRRGIVVGVHVPIGALALTIGPLIVARVCSTRTLGTLTFETGAVRVWTLQILCIGTLGSLALHGVAFVVSPDDDFVRRGRAARLGSRRYPGRGLARGLRRGVSNRLWISRPARIDLVGCASGSERQRRRDEQREEAKFHRHTRTAQ